MRATGHRRPQNAALGPQKAHSGGLRDLILEPPRPIFHYFGVRLLATARRFCPQTARYQKRAPATSPHTSFQGAAVNRRRRRQSAAPWQACSDVEADFVRFCRSMQSAKQYPPTRFRFTDRLWTHGGPTVVRLFAIRPSQMPSWSSRSDLFYRLFSGRSFSAVSGAFFCVRDSFWRPRPLRNLCFP